MAPEIRLEDIFPQLARGRLRARGSGRPGGTSGFSAAKAPPRSAAMGTPAQAMFRPVLQHLMEKRSKPAAEQAVRGAEGPGSRAKEVGTAPEMRQWADYTIKRGDTLWALATKRFHVRIRQLMEDNGITDPRRLRPGRRIRVRLPSYPQKLRVVASWYGVKYQGRKMANGEPFDMHGATIAHRELPLGTRVELHNPETGQRVEAIVSDRGPFVEGRDVDLSYGLARRLSLVRKGVGRLVMRVLG